MNKGSLTGRAKKPAKEYEVFYIGRKMGNLTDVEPDRGTGAGKFVYETYHEAYQRAGDYAHFNEWVTDALIVSNHGTSVVITRKHLLEYRIPAK